MLTRWNDYGLSRSRDAQVGNFERSLRVLDVLRRDMGRWFADFDRTFGNVRRQGALSTAWPGMSWSDKGSELLVQIDLPGFEEKDVGVAVDGGSLTVSGRRKTDQPDRHGVHRRERGAVQFTRTVALPTKVEAKKVHASLRHGVLEIRLPKQADALRKQISVKGG